MKELAAHAFIALNLCAAFDSDIAFAALLVQNHRSLARLHTLHPRNDLTNMNDPWCSHISAAHASKTSVCFIRRRTKTIPWRAT